MSKKLFFWANFYIHHPEVGTTAKIISEVKTLRLMGFEVYYTAYLDNGVAIYDNNDNLIAFISFFTKCKSLINVIKKDYLVHISRKFLQDKQFDIFLLRINYIGKTYFKMLKEMKAQGAFIMMESLSYYPNIDFGDIKKASYMMISGSLKRHAKDLHTVVDLMLTEGVINDFYGIPCIEFGMGVEVDRYKRHSYQGKLNELNLLMVGCDSIYHVTDRIILSLKHYLSNTNRTYNVKLHLVGDILAKDKKLIRESSLKDNVICYGKQFGKELDDIFDKCNIALGPLAQHRIQKKDTGLKTKEYFARGIPYLYTGEEKKVGNNYPYIFQLDDTEDIVDFKKIFQFYDSIKPNTKIADDMRSKACEVFSWKSIFKNVVDVYFEFDSRKQIKN